jgi:hypothetical protein
MRLAKSSRTFLPLALSAVLATCAFAQEHPNISPNAVRDQLSKAGQPSQGASSAAPQSPSQAGVKGPKKKAPAGPAVKTAAAAPAKPADASKAPAAAANAAPAKPPVEQPAEEKPVVRRDPFDTLLTKAKAGNAPPENLPPGKAGLIVDTLHIDGIVHGPSGMIAIVSNAQKRVYFLRDGDKLYDGDVDKIALDSISFHEIGKDAFGKPLERTVTKRLYPSPGEQQ